MRLGQLMLQGQQIGPYYLEKFLGGGGMSAVYLATYSNDTGFAKQVAVKVLYGDDIQDAERRSLLADEARAAALLPVHPNLGRITNFMAVGEHLIIEMDLIHGFCLETILNKLRNRGLYMPRNVVSNIMCQVCDGLAQVHRTAANGHRPDAVHGDLKPGNIMVDLQGWVKVIDFGLIRSPSICRTELDDGIVRGTPSFMSPEQVTGEPMDLRSDIFVAGSVLFELLHNKTAFRRSNPTKTLITTAKADCFWQLQLTRENEPEFAPVLEKCWKADAYMRHRDAPALKRAIREAQAPTSNEEVAEWLDEWWDLPED